MEKKKQVVFRRKARRSIHEIALYIEQKGYPETAEKYAKKLTDFGDSLAIFPKKYTICRQQGFARRNFSYATFDKTYVFLYKPVKNKLIIYNVIHGKRLG
ncbi:MAG: type II toxin-antitoxin system RelE/ParE family toxin [Bacteroidota bacterium]